MVVSSFGASLTFALATISANNLQPASPKWSCPNVISIPYNMGVGTRYAKGDTSYSQIEPQAVAREKRVRSVISGPVSQIARIADRWRQATPAARPAIAQCLQKHLLAQANARAMEGSHTAFDAYYREWMLTSIAISYLKAKPDLDKIPGKDAIFEWLRKSAQSVEKFNETQIKLGRIDNHRYWGALACMTIGKVVNDPDLVNFSRSIRKTGLNNVQQDGTLDAELNRKALAFHYHLFAAAALGGLILLDRNVVPQDQLDSMTRLTTAIAQHMESPEDSVFFVKTGISQNPEDHRSMAYMLLPFAGSKKIDMILSIFLHNTPKNYQFLGGNLDFLIKK